MAPLLEVRDLRTQFTTDDGLLQAVDGVSFTVEPGQVLGIVGESGCGKSVTCLTIMGLNDPRLTTSTGEVLFRGEDLLKASSRRLRAVRGNEIAMIFQDPMTSLNPVHTIGAQLSEAVTLHRDVSRKEARARALELLEAVRIPRAERRIDDYPHQFSGGMRQRVMIAMALINSPDLLIADEPTTALDVTTQAQILELLKQLQKDFGTAIIMITHDLGVVAETCDDVVVMYSAKVVEHAEVDEIFERPQHPYTWGLMGSLPRLEVVVDRLQQIPGQPPSLLNPPNGCRFHPRCPYTMAVCKEKVPELEKVPGEVFHEQACHLDPVTKEREAAKLLATVGVVRDMSEPGVNDPGVTEQAAEPMELTGDELLVVDSVTKHFPITRGIIFQKAVAAVKAVDGVSFSLQPGETLGIVGESGCGKSTLVRCILKLLEPTSGRIIFQGEDITKFSRKEMRARRRDMMMVFQDPYASLNARKRVGFIVGEVLEIHGIGTPAERKRRVQELLEIVGLNPEHYNRFPHEFSGGQRQRIGVARALAINPKLILCDEPVSALDVSVQAQILNLLKDLQKEFGLSYVFIAHDLNVVRHISDRVMVMYLGKAVEVAPREELYANPKHPYTGALLSAVPIPNPALGRLRNPILLEGDVPNPINPPAACNFHPRCPKFHEGHCDVETPPLETMGPEHLVACHYPLERSPLESVTAATR